MPDEDKPETATGYRAALRVPLVRRLWAATAASEVGDYVGQGALLFLAADRTGRAIGVAAVLAVGVLPALLTGALAGSWLDRIPRIPALVTLQILGAIIICLPVFFGSAAAVFITAALLAAVRTASISVRSGAMAEGIHDDHRGPLIALMGTTDQASQVIGYITGGALYLLLGANVALLVDAASFLIGAAVLARLRLPQPTTRPPKPPITAGIRDIMRDPVLRMLAGLVVVTGTVASLPETLAPSVAGPGDPWRPIVLAAGPLGQAVTMAVMGRLTIIRRPSVQLLHFLWLAFALGLAALGQSAAWFAMANLLVGVGVAWIMGPQLTFLRLAPATRMAQITGTMVAMLATAEGIGSLGLAAVADAAGVPAAYRLGGAMLLIAAIIGWVVKERTPRAKQLDRDEMPELLSSD